MAGVGGCLFLSSKAHGEANAAEVKKKERKIVYRTLGKTGIKLPVVSMGVMNTDNYTLVRAALDSGMVMLDTAQSYRRGQSEIMLGEMLKGRPRDSYVLATKAYLPRNQKTGLYGEEATEQAFLKKVDLSLKQLKLDYVDIYYHHNVVKRESALFEPVLKALEKIKKEGKARFVGITTHSNEPEVIDAAVDSRLYDVVLTAYNFQQQHYPEVKAAIARAAQAGLGVVGMKGIRGGNQQPPSAMNPAAALKWQLQDPNVHTIIPGFTTFEEMNADLALMTDFSLSDSEKKQLQKQASLSGLYCQGCRECLGACVAELPIPDLMRAYMYTYAYRNVSHAQELLVSLDLPDQPCQDCSECAVQCSVGFNVPAKIRDIIRLRHVPAEFIV